MKSSLLHMKKISQTQNDYFRNPQIDFGLSRFTFFAILYNLGLVVFGFICCKNVFATSLKVLVIQSVLFYNRVFFVKKGAWVLFIANTISLSSFMWFNYILVGQIDLSMGGLHLFDQSMAKFDDIIFGMPVAHYFFLKTRFLGMGQNFEQ